MIGIVDELTETLAEELRFQRALLEMGTKKRDALVALDTATVDAVTRREQNLLLALGATASARLKLIIDAGKILQLPPESGIAAIADRAGEPVASKLRALAKELRVVMGDLARVTKMCRTLAEESLGHVKRFFRILATAGQGHGGYTRRGAPPATGPARLLIDEVV